jgi:ATP-dependent RNA helicase RhlE
MNFVDLGLREQILSAVANQGYSTATPIQAQAIPPILAGKDVLGSAQTGTGKTAAFALPILQRLAEIPKHSNKPILRCVVLCPTRELATQIGESFRDYGRNLQLRHVVIFGGVSARFQIDALRRGVDIAVATPGRFLDLLMQGQIDLRNCEVLVLDEADRMLDMGFINDIRKIVARLPKQRQTLFFSATMPVEIRRLADAMLRNPVTVHVAPVATAAEGIDQSVYFVERHNKPALLAHLVDQLPMPRAIVFSRTKHGADRVVRQLHLRGIRAEAIHGNKSQNARQRALANFKAGKTPVLVATDIASRGLQIDDISHVVNYDLTHEPETYIHRIGRTARAGASGSAISFCDREEVPNLRAIEKLLRKQIPVKTDQPAYSAQLADHGARDHAPREHAERERAQREHAQRGNGHRDHAQRQQSPRDQGSRDRGPRDHASREHAPREHSPRAVHAQGARGQSHSRPANSHQTHSHTHPRPANSHPSNNHTHPRAANSFRQSPGARHESPRPAAHHAAPKPAPKAAHKPVHHKPRHPLQKQR